MKIFSHYLSKHRVLNSFVQRLEQTYIKAIFKDHIKSE